MWNIHLIFLNNVGTCSSSNGNCNNKNHISQILSVSSSWYHTVDMIDYISSVVVYHQTKCNILIKDSKIRWTRVMCLKSLTSTGTCHSLHRDNEYCYQCLINQWHKNNHCFSVHKYALFYKCTNCQYKKNQHKQLITWNRFA